MIATRILVALFAAPCLAQDPTPDPAGKPAAPNTPPAVTINHPTLRYPRDKAYVVATVDDKPITLGDLVEHIDERHYPGFEKFLAGPEGKGSPDGNRILQSDLIAPWVRNFADVKALEAEAGPLDRADKAELDACIGAALKVGFESFLENYVADLQMKGRPTNLSEARLNRLLSDFQMRQGMTFEMQGWLDYLRPVQNWTRQELSDFFQNNARIFGGGVNLAHILIYHRDPGTGILLNKSQRAGAKARLLEIQNRLKNGADFDESVRLFSEDSATAPTGGVFKNVERFDFRLPPAICRKVWHMQDGEVSDVIETPYGWHIVKRLEHVQGRFMLFTDAALPSIRLSKQRMNQENLLFEARKKHKVELNL